MVESKREGTQEDLQLAYDEADIDYRERRDAAASQGAEALDAFDDKNKPPAKPTYQRNAPSEPGGRGRRRRPLLWQSPLTRRRGGGRI